jgi:hypothetical protein
MTTTADYYPIIKVCSCGRTFHFMPKTATFMNDSSDLRGWYFDCDRCNSTLFIPVK